MKKKINKNKNHNINQRSFYFDDYLVTNQKSKKIKNSFISEDRIYLLFFLFFTLILIFSIKISLVSMQNPEFLINKKDTSNSLTARRDIVDRNNVLLSRNIVSYHAAIRSHLIKDHKKFIINIKLILPKLNFNEVKKNLVNKKYFYLKKRLTNIERNKLWALGEKGIIFESFQSRIYPHASLYSHTLGQIDNDNYGISGVERFFDKELKNQNKINQPLYLSLDTNLQYLIKSQLKKSMNTFQAKGAAGLLMDADNGQVLSLVSLPDYDINKRQNINSNEFSNKITKSIFELGSIFKTFTIALAIEKKIVEPKTIIKNIPNKIKCSKHEISDIKVFPKNLSTENILIRSSNVGTLMIARKIGEENYKKFLQKLNLLNTPNFELDEVGTPLNFKWDKCKLETVSFGHGITTTPLQAASAYASLVNGGHLVYPTLYKDRKTYLKKRIISEDTSNKIQKILRKVVTDEKGTASLADIFGYSVSGKTGTSQYYNDKNKNINTFISFFIANHKKYILLVMLDNPQVASDLTYNYRGVKIKGTRNEAGWNAVYSAGKIIEQIGPILAINSKEFDNNHVVKKLN
jgi:cell division protein FtsI (penicillin-binding protein 3)